MCAGRVHREGAQLAAPKSYNSPLFRRNFCKLEEAIVFWLSLSFVDLGVFSGGAQLAHWRICLNNKVYEPHGYGYVALNHAEHTDTTINTMYGRG